MMQANPKSYFKTSRAKEILSANTYVLNIFDLRVQQCVKRLYLPIWFSVLRMHVIKEKKSRKKITYHSPILDRAEASHQH